jgi:hypothetical protein
VNSAVILQQRAATAGYNRPPTCPLTPHLMPLTRRVTPCTASPSCAMMLPTRRCTCVSRPSQLANSSIPPSQAPSSVRGICARVTRAVRFGGDESRAKSESRVAHLHGARRRVRVEVDPAAGGCRAAQRDGVRRLGLESGQDERTRIVADDCLQLLQTEQHPVYRCQ